MEKAIEEFNFLTNLNKDLNSHRFEFEIYHVTGDCYLGFSKNDKLALKNIKKEKTL